MFALPKHFGFLKKYGGRLEEDLHYPGLPKQIRRLQERGFSGESYELDTIASSCRKIVEWLFKALLPDAQANDKLKDFISQAASRKVIPPSIARKCQDLRLIGNAGTHASVSAVEAREALALLDHVLRWYVVEHYQDNQEDPFPPEYADDILTPEILMKPQDLVSKVQIATDLSGNPSLASRANEAYGKASRASRAFNLGIEDMSRRIPDVPEDGSLPDGSSAESRAILERCDAELAELTSRAEAALADLEGTSKEVDGILSEHDFIGRLLRGNGQSTLAQWRVMRFPREANSSTNILQIAGGAGTGKTLCLIAKTLRELDDRGQSQLFENPKRALFVCFNRDLATHVRELVSVFPEIAAPTVITHDTLVNQLVKPNPDDPEYAQHAASSRYGAGWTLHYASKEWSPKRSPSTPRPLIEAIESVAERHPERAGAYYLDTSCADCLSWVSDEMGWIEAHYDTAIDAQELYPTAPRTGRSAAGYHRPNFAARLVILEIWNAYAQKLRERRMYTIEQATKRLLKEDDLPQYDIIAIDEVQDLSINEIRFLLKLRCSDASKVFLAGDENQKIFQRDFTWKELDAGVHGYTIKLSENMRNSSSIQCFSERLLDVPCSFEEASRDVYVLDLHRDKLLRLINALLKYKHERTAIIGPPEIWKAMLNEEAIPYRSPQSGITEPGLYLTSERTGKGLEFDNVIVDCDRPFYADDPEAEKHLRYMHFTRAIRRLYVCYEGTAPELLRKYYPDFI